MTEPAAGKRFARMKHDLYQTIDERAWSPLLEHVSAGTEFFEPCAGEGKMVMALAQRGLTCVGASDISLYRKRIRALEIKRADATKLILPRRGAKVITNPPWSRELLHAIILNLYWQADCWFLLDANWAHTEQARPYMPLCRNIVSVGRLQWFENSRWDAEDDCAWYNFAVPPGAHTLFHGRL